MLKNSKNPTFVILSVAKNHGGTGILPVQLLNRLEACSTTFFNFEDA
jgi:hypothetical protein